MPRREPSSPAAGRRIDISLSCMVCGARNYRTTRTRRDGIPFPKLNKFCKTCNAHTAHIEAK